MGKLKQQKAYQMVYVKLKQTLRMREAKFPVLKQISNKNLSQYLHQSCYRNKCLWAAPILSCTLQLKKNQTILEVMATGIEALSTNVPIYRFDAHSDNSS